MPLLQLMSNSLRSIRLLESLQFHGLVLRNISHGPKLRVPALSHSLQLMSNSLHTIRLLEFLQFHGLVLQCIYQGPKLQVSSFKSLTQLKYLTVFMQLDY